MVKTVKGFLALLTLGGLICFAKHSTRRKHKSIREVELEGEIFELGKSVFYELSFGDMIRKSPFGDMLRESKKE